MRHFQLNSKYATSILRFLAVAVSSLPLHAGDAVAVDWNQVCRVAGNHELLVITTTGDMVEGFCVGINVNEVSVSTNDHKVVKIARNTLSRIEMHRARRNQLKSLRDGMRGGLHWGFESLLSPWAPLGAVMIPGTLAWGAVAAPFCLIGDLRAKVEGLQERKLN